jgi:hypothetical protein
LDAYYPTIFSAHARAFLRAHAADNDISDLDPYSPTISNAHTEAFPIAHTTTNNLS